MCRNYWIIVLIFVYMIILSRVMQLLQCRKIKIRKSNEISRKSFFVCIEYKENTYIYIYKLLRSISRRSMRIRPFAEQSGKLKRAVGVLFFYRKVYIYIYDMVTQSGMYNGYNIPRNSIMLTQPRSNSPGMPARIVIR